MRGQRPGQSVAVFILWLTWCLASPLLELRMMLDSAEHLAEILSKLKYHPKLPEIGVNF